MKVAIIGATGLVGNMMLKVLIEQNFPVSDLILSASSKSIGKILPYKGKDFKIISLQEVLDSKPDIALFSAGKEVSLEWAPKFAQQGTVIIDNSSAWRMHPDIKLVVPEINAVTLTARDKIIANPNCSTIQLVMVLAPLHKAFKVKRVVVSTYQSITGTGARAVTQMENERKGLDGFTVYPYPIDKNCIPQCDVFEDNGYTKEEMKIINETKKILDDYTINITATAVRVPVVGGHSESVNIEFENVFDLNDVKNILESSTGIVVQDNIKSLIYPMPKLSEGKNEVFVGRIRKDESAANTLNLWIVSDNLRKGAATNAVQIAGYILQHHLLNVQI